MAKRLSATEKWDKAWFRKLPPKYKCFWEYLRDKCDLIGLWEIDYEAASFHIGAEIKKSEVIEFLKEKIMLVDDKILILGFCHFQYGTVLNLKSPIHKKIYNLLVKHTLYNTLYDRGKKEVDVKGEDKVIHLEEAYNFLKIKEPEKIELFEMQNRSSFTDYNIFIVNFNSKVIEEALDWDTKILMARLFRLKVNWDFTPKDKKDEKKIGRQTLSTIEQNAKGWD